jgi:hypothetical protein
MMQELPAMEWPPEWDVQPGFLAELFIDAMNRRPRLDLDESLISQTFDVDAVMANDVGPFVNTLGAAGGNADIAEALVSINALVARDVVRLLEEIPSDDTEIFPSESTDVFSFPDPEVRFPDVARRMAGQPGILHAWVEVALEERAEDDIDTIRRNQEMWETDKRMLDMLSTFLPLPAGFEVAGLLSSTILDAVSPDFTSQEDDVRATMRSVRNGYRNVSAGIFVRALESQRAGADSDGSPSAVGLMDATSDRDVDLYGGWVLAGWNRELNLLGRGGFEF